MFTFQSREAWEQGYVYLGNEGQLSNSQCLSVEQYVKRYLLILKILAFLWLRHEKKYQALSLVAQPVHASQQEMV